MLSDLFNDCYSGDHQRMSPEQFKQTFCNVCQNSGCQNSKTGRSLWITRILNQEEVLLRNPKFAGDDAGLDLPDFKDVLQKVLALEVGAKKGDWSIPSEGEIQDAARVLVGHMPPPVSFTATIEAVPVKPVSVRPLPERWIVKGDGKTDYEVSLTHDGIWSCTCRGFEFKKSCKHVQDLQAKLEYAPQAPVAPEAIAPVQTGRGAPFLPPSRNTQMPSQGIMVGSPQIQTAKMQTGPEADPWAPPEKVTQVGGRITLGSSKPKP